MPSHPSHARVRLGEMLVRRRIELDPRYRNRRTFTDERASGLYRIINDIEVGNRDNFESGTIAALEAAYAVTPGSIARAYDGGELEPIQFAEDEAETPAVDLFPGATGEMVRALEPYIDEVRVRVSLARLKQAQARGAGDSARPLPPLSGRMVFPLDPQSAALWDQVAAVGFRREEGVIRGTAVLLAWQQQEDAEEREGNSATGLMRGYFAGHHVRRKHFATMRV